MPSQPAVEFGVAGRTAPVIRHLWPAAALAALFPSTTVSPPPRRATWPRPGVPRNEAFKSEAAERAWLGENLAACHQGRDPAVPWRTCQGGRDRRTRQPVTQLGVDLFLAIRSMDRVTVPAS